MMVYYQHTYLMYYMTQ